MKFILLNHEAVNDIASDRVLQAPAFSQANTLAEVLLRRGALTFSPRVACVEHADGIYMLKSSPTPGDHYLVFDLRQSDVFTNFDVAEVLTIFQKTLRFALRIWNNQKLTPSDHILQGTTKALIFPFPISTRSKFRIGIDRKPDAERMTRRGTGNHLLVFFSSQGDVDIGNPTLATFRDALAGVKDAMAHGSSATPAQVTPQSPLNVTRLADSNKIMMPPHMGFEFWKTHLTKEQKSFVERPLLGAERIEGPAGTGKTLCLVLRAIHMLRSAQDANREYHISFVAHGEATKSSVMDILASNDPDCFYQRERLSSTQSMTLTTLQEWCASQLGKQFSETEYLDRDAMEAKQLRQLYVTESVEEAMALDFETHKSFLSPEFCAFLSSEDHWIIAEMMQHEIGVMIKGRAQEDLDIYKQLPLIDYNLPLKTPSDRSFVFVIFQRYQEKLTQVSQFDTDDIVLTTIGQLNTPIWRRRRVREAFDSVIVDETHLFNLNELSVFHLMTKEEHEHRIVFSADRTQAPGDRGLTSALLDSTILDGAKAGATETRINSMFRCSPQITSLALSVTAGGATLFTTFEDPLANTTTVSTYADESKSTVPIYRNCANDEALADEVLSRAQDMATALECARSAILVVAFSDELLSLIEKRAKLLNKPLEIVKRRGDLDVVLQARKNGRFVLSTPDFVGGLEFDGVLLAGVDEGRVPPSGPAALSESRLFLNFSWHNRLYVAITRAKYKLEVFGVSERGPSPVLSSAISRQLLETAS